MCKEHFLLLNRLHTINDHVHDQMMVVELKL